jgi:stage V sporulation protein G
MIMEITSIKIIPFDTGTRGGKIRAVADVEFDNVLLVKGIRVLEGASGGLFLGMPSIRKRDGTYRDMVVLTEKSFSDDFRHQIIEAYRNYDRIG